MTTYPLIGDYDLAVSHLDKFVKAPHFAGGVPALNRQNQIFGYSGGYSVVYQISVNGKKMALRCWIKDPGNVKERYTRVKSYLIANPTSYFVDFGYVDVGIVAKGSTYPVSYMDWIDGKTLSQFIDENISNSTVINELAEKFLTMVRELHSKKIAHGDLQDGNIVVCKNNHTLDLRLVDYDSLYTPTLQNWHHQDDLMGVPDYQHPKRYKKANEKADYFSELVIFLSLLTYAERPSLWKKGQEKRLLFVVDDFYNPANSTTFHTLKTLSPRIRNLADRLEKFCYETDTNILLPLEQLIPISDSFEAFFGSIHQPTHTPVPDPSTTPTKTSSPSDFSDFFGSSPPQSAPLPRYNHPPSQPISPHQGKNSAWQNLTHWLSISSHLTVTPLGFWKTIFISALLSSLVVWVLKQSNSFSEFFVFTLLFLVVPLSYLLTKNKIGIFLSLLGIAGFDYLLNYFGGWTEVIILSVMAIAGVVGFNGISSPRISFVRIFTTTGLSAMAFIVSTAIMTGPPPIDLEFVSIFSGTIFTATILSIVVTKIFRRG